MIRENETIDVTATDRLARFLHADHARDMAVAGHRAWERPGILSAGAFQAELFHRVALVADEPAPLLLSAAQSGALWRTIINGSDAAALLMRPARTAARVASAWDRLRAWRLDPGDVDPGGSPDVAAFRDWALAFERRCREAGWLDGGSLAGWLSANLGRHPDCLPRRVCFRGFDEMTPAQEALAAALADAGVNVEHLPFERRGESRTLAPCPDAAAEVSAAARQARRWLDANPSARVGIVVPDLERRRPALSRALESALIPAARRSVSPPSDPPWNVSLGVPLKRVGLIADALTALNLMHGELGWEAAGRLLRSPHFDGAWEERGARAAMDEALRRRGERRWSLPGLERMAETCGAPRLRTGLVACGSVRNEITGHAAPGEWARLFGAWLRALGWCRGRSLGSGDYQAQQAWFDLLRSLARVGSISGGMTLGEARELLAELAADTLFQPESAEAPVQVMGMIEAAGLTFDHLWVMGLSADNWPRPPAPNPFLPLALQRRMDMPHASARRELAYAENITRRLWDSAPDVVLSWPRRDGDTALEPSPLLPEAPEREAPTATGDLDAWRRPGQVTAVTDRPPPPAPAGPGPGGSGLLTDQAACPFRAFAHRRLHARPLEQPAVGLGPAARGSLVHKALQFLWEDLGSRDRLLSLDQAGRRARARTAAARARRETQRDLPKQEPAFWSLEERRLARLLLRWLDVDAARPAFGDVRTEERAVLDLAGLTLELRADRMDTLEDGGLVIIDYKTGSRGHSPKAWLGERPDEPQLPSYALALDEPGRLAGLAFGQVNARKPELRGIGVIDGELKLLTNRAWSERPEGCGDLAAMRRYWRERLEALAASYRDGVSHTDPNHARVCDFCFRQVICRVREIAAPAADDEEAADG